MAGSRARSLPGRSATSRLGRALATARSAVAEVRRDVRSVRERDPAAKTDVEVLLLYSGLHAVWAHRVGHALWRRGVHTPARAVSQAARFLTGIEIHPGAQLGQGVFIDHGMGVVIGETAEVGDDVTIYHGVTLGGVSLDEGKRHPTVGDGVTIGAGAKVLGNITVGAGSRIGANSVLVRSVDPGSVVVGVPGQVVSGRAVPEAPAPHKTLHVTGDPDPLGRAVKGLLERVEQLERQEGRAVSELPASELAYRPDTDSWVGEDFSI
jgi:serine O-acetyltransferase